MTDNQLDCPRCEIRMQAPRAARRLIQAKSHRIITLTDESSEAEAWQQIEEILGAESRNWELQRIITDEPRGPYAIIRNNNYQAPALAAAEQEYHNLLAQYHETEHHPQCPRRTQENLRNLKKAVKNVVADLYRALINPKTTPPR